MKKFSLPLILTIAVFTISAQAYDFKDAVSFGNIWQQDNTLVSDEGRFSVVLPAGVDKSYIQLAKRTNQTDSGNITLNQYTANFERGTLIMVYYDLPESIFANKSVQKILDDARDGGVGNVNGTLDKETPISIDGNQGVAIQLQAESGGLAFYIRSDFVVAKPRLYNYLYISRDKSELEKADILSFFNSFKIKKSV